MATKTSTRQMVGAFEWIHSNELATWRDEDEQTDATPETCFTCRQPVTSDDQYWFCADNSEEVHQDCRIPNFDHE